MLNKNINDCNCLVTKKSFQETDEFERKKIMKIRLQLENVLHKYYDFLVNEDDNMVTF